jgi:23S rRNA pseudouridine1911/1915/1917 synthase
MDASPNASEHKFVVPDRKGALRLDIFVAAQFPDMSRSRAAELIDGGMVAVDGHETRRAKRLKGGETITVVIEPPEDVSLHPVELPLSVLYEDEYLLVFDKQAGLVVHPGAGTHEPTLVHGLLHAYPEIARVGEPDRPGIVHRLDKDTSGCLMVARTEEARLKLIDLFARRRVHKEYHTLVRGVPREDRFSIDCVIGRSIRDRTRMSVATHDGRRALTHVSVVESFGTLASALAVRIVTGRTHQIRVHMAYAGLPVLGDDIYGQRARQLSKRVGAERQMLHAHKLSFTHPFTGAELVIVSPLPPDIERVTEALHALARSEG